MPESSEKTKLFVNEIFSSVQGEGPRIGQVVTFIRLGGCALKCTWCDTKYAFQDGKYMDMETLVSKTVGKPQHIVWTGGEPMEQLTVEHLKFFPNHTFSLETNGTRFNTTIARRMDVIVVSPKPRMPREKNAGQFGMDEHYLDNITRWMSYNHSYLKFVIDTKVDEVKVQEQLSQVMRITNRVEYADRPIYLQPMDHGDKGFAQRIEEYYYLYIALLNRGVFAENDMCVLPQLHKWVKLR